MVPIQHPKCKGAKQYNLVSTGSIYREQLESQLVPVLRESNASLNKELNEYKNSLLITGIKINYELLTMNKINLS